MKEIDRLEPHYHGCRFHPQIEYQWLDILIEIMESLKSEAADKLESFQETYFQDRKAISG